jgi:predicted nuclease of predicted toxin-antitoxin system
MDEHVEAAITNELRNRGIDVLTIQDDGRQSLADREVLSRATELGRIVVKTRDEDFLREATFRQRRRQTFGGVIYAHQIRVSIGDCVRDLELFAGVLEPEEFVDRVEYLPIR